MDAACLGWDLAKHTSESNSEGVSSFPVDHHQQNSDIGNLSAVTTTRSGYHVNKPAKRSAAQEGGGGGSCEEVTQAREGVT